MFIRRLLFMFCCFTIVHTVVRAQNFCSALDSIVNDGANRFKNVKGATTKANESGISWESKVQIPGVIKARFVSAMGLYYEGAVAQTTDTLALHKEYDHWKQQLNECLLGKRYKLTATDNFEKHTAAFKKLVYMQASEADIPPPHISLEVDYMKEKGLYTIVLYVWEH